MKIQAIDPGLATAIGSILNKFKSDVDERVKSLADSIPKDWKDEAEERFQEVSKAIESHQREMAALVDTFRDEQSEIMKGVAGDITTLTGLLELVESSSDKASERLVEFSQEAEEGMVSLRSRIGALSEDVDKRLEGYQVHLDLIRDELQKTMEAQGRDIHDDIIAHVEEKTDWARLNADLWKEQTKNKLSEIDAYVKAATEAADQLRAMSDEKSEEIVRLKSELDATLKQRLIPMGPYRKGETYDAGNCVMRDGATFWSLIDDNNHDPREKLETPVWRLLSMRGERGEKGDRGQRGEKGEPGRNGKDGVGIVGMVSKGLTIVVATSDGQTIRADLSDGLEELIDERIKTLVNLAEV